MNQLARKKCILIVDDDPRVLRFMEIELKLFGFEVMTATRGKQALELVKKFRPDVMLLDIMMPDMDGFEVVRQVRDFSQIPVIALSASIANGEQALKSGANEFHTKPFRVRDIVKRIENYIDEHSN